MKAEINEWLLPMLEQVDLSAAEMQALVLQASFPAAETATPIGDWIAGIESPGCGVRVRAVDWIEFGRLLRQKLGWSDYPDSPVCVTGDSSTTFLLG